MFCLSQWFNFVPIIDHFGHNTRRWIGHTSKKYVWVKHFQQDDEFDLTWNELDSKWSASAPGWVWPWQLLCAFCSGWKCQSTLCWTTSGMKHITFTVWSIWVHHEFQWVWSGTLYICVQSYCNVLEEHMWWKHTRPHMCYFCFIRGSRWVWEDGGHICPHSFIHSFNQYFNLTRMDFMFICTKWMRVLLGNHACEGWLPT